jgi:hypothetical protein
MFDNVSNPFLAKSASILVDVLEKIVAVALILYFSSKNIKYGVAVCVLCIVFFIMKSKLGERVEEGMSINIQGFDDNDDDDDDTNISGLTQTVEIVVARYNEDLSWLKYHPFNKFDTIIYNKGTNNRFYKPEKLKYIENLENVGKCDHTYLYHIIKNYNKLADITIFLPGSCNMDWKLKKAKRMIRQIHKNNRAVILYNENMENVLDKIYNFYLDFYENAFEINRIGNSTSDFEPSKIRPFGKWYKYHFSDIRLKYVTYGGIFSVAKEDIHNNPPYFYQDFLDEISNSSNPEVGHYIERSWYSIFYPIHNTKFMYYQHHPNEIKN